MTAAEFNKRFKPNDDVVFNGQRRTLRSAAVTMGKFVGAMVSGETGYVNVDLISKPTDGPTVEQLQAIAKDAAVVLERARRDIDEVIKRLKP